MYVNKEEVMLLQTGCTGIKYHNKINNYFIDFNRNNKHYTVEHVLNVYGSAVDYWEVLIDSKYYPEHFRSLQAICGALKGGII